jgi:hypothetical protein
MCRRRSRRRLQRIGEFERFAVMRTLTKVNDELRNLKTSDPLLPPDTDATSTLEVVPVHDNVNHEIESDGDPGDRGETDELGVAEESSCAMVVGMEES